MDKKVIYTEEGSEITKEQMAMLLYRKNIIELQEEVKRLKEESQQQISRLSDENTRRLNAEERMTDLEQRLYMLNQELESTKFQYAKTTLIMAEDINKLRKENKHSYSKGHNEASADKMVEIYRFKKENKQLKEALRKCEPWLVQKRIPPTIDSIEAYEAVCRLCDGKFDHADDCEYIRLTKGREVE